MISMGIMATALAVIWGSFSISQRTREAATAKNERIRTVQAALRRMQREISMAFVSKIGQIPTNERGEETYFTAFIGQNDRLDFSNFAHTRTRMDEVGSQQAEIAYFVRSERGEDGRLHDNLVRREQSPIDGEPEDGGYIYTLLRDVESIEFEYWRPDREIAGDAWEREWDTRDNGMTLLPPRVRITLEIAHPLKERETLRFVVQSEIQLTQPIGFVTQGLTSEQMEMPTEDEVIDFEVDFEDSDRRGRERSDEDLD